ncbi:hypothetical protein AB3N02_21715 [Priestia aryabhattai]|uniref:hypothetical protein n=1 Tax=Priestia aryabhattai TaxID=412384 RepID=UPI0039A1F077
MKELIDELESLLYSKLLKSDNGKLSFDDIMDIFDSKPEYGLRIVCGGAIRKIKERKDVYQLKDEKDRPYLKLKE